MRRSSEISDNCIVKTKLRFRLSVKEKSICQKDKYRTTKKIVRLQISTKIR